MEWYAIIFLAIFIEGSIAYLKTICVNRIVRWQTLLAIIGGLVLALCYHIDILVITGVMCYPTYIGEIMTGIIISRISDYIVHILCKLGCGGTQISSRY